MKIFNGVEGLFKALDESANIIKESMDLTYLEALALAGENLFQKQVVSDITKTDIIQKLENYIKECELENLQAEQIRKAFQLAVLKGMKEGVQAHHALTPDAVALFISYLVNKLMNKKDSYTLYDPAVGSANLLTAILNQTKSRVTSYGFDVDETLIQLAYVSSNLQKKEVELFHQDSIKPSFIDHVDIVVSDLPVGYYPNESVASQYELNTDDERPFVHHLLIEKSLNCVRAGGYLVFLIPNTLFVSTQSAKLQKYIKEKAVILGLLQLPQSMFKSESQGKSIFILQKKGEDVVAPSQALLAELPSFSRKEALVDMMKQIDKWIAHELKI